MTAPAFCRTAVVECEVCQVKIVVSLIEAPEMMTAFLNKHDAVWIHPVVPSQRKPPE